MADNIQATPRNYFGGLLSDAYNWMQSPQRTQQMQGFAGLLGTTGVPQTIERMAYGEPLTNIGRANVPLLKPETADALMTIAPMVGPAARGAKMLPKNLPVGMSIKPVDDVVSLLTPKNSFTYPQEEAMRLAQQRAALPVSEGGLGLKPNNTAAERADAMFPFDVYHGTKTEIKSIDPDKSLINKAFFTSEDPNFASSPAYTGYINPPSKGGGNVMPLRINKSNANVVDELSYNPMVEAGYIENIRNLGNDLIDVQKDGRNIILNPDVVRSRFAAFDPFRKTAATAAAMGVAAPDLLAQEQPVITQQQIDDELAKYGLLGR